MSRCESLAHCVNVAGPHKEPDEPSLSTDIVILPTVVLLRVAQTIRPLGGRSLGSLFFLPAKDDQSTLPLTTLDDRTLCLLIAFVLVSVLVSSCLFGGCWSTFSSFLHRCRGKTASTKALSCYLAFDNIPIRPDLRQSCLCYIKASQPYNTHLLLTQPSNLDRPYAFDYLDGCRDRQPPWYRL